MNVPRRGCIALTIGALAAVYVFARAQVNPAFGSDFDQIWYAARVLLSHGSPYLEIGPGRPGNWPWPFYYPATAAVLAMPLAPLSVIAARCVFTGLSSAALAYALSVRGVRGLVPLASGAFLSAVQMCQWSPLLAAAMLLPSLAWAAALKPNVGIVQLAGTSNVRAIWPAVVGSLMLAIVAFLYLPSWLGDWLATSRGALHIRPLAASWFGAPLLLAILRWRRPEARVLFALAVVPTNAGVHDALLLLAVPQPLMGVMLLSASTLLVDPMIGDWPSYSNFAAYAAASSRALLALVYLPALVMVLRRRNEGPAPEWLDRLAVRLPQWLRGQAAQSTA